MTSMSLPKPVALRVSEDQLAVVDLFAEVAGVSRSEMIRTLVHEALGHRVRAEPHSRPDDTVVVLRATWDEMNARIEAARRLHHALAPLRPLLDAMPVLDRHLATLGETP